MSLHRTKLWLTLWTLFVLAAAPASAQDLQDMQIFAPVEIDGFGGGPRAKEGAFLQIEGIYWSLSKPEVAPIGSRYLPNRVANITPSRVVYESNSFSNCDFESKFVFGQRWDLGYIHGHDGVMVSFFDLHHQSQGFTFGSITTSYGTTIGGGATVIFEDNRTGGDLQGYLGNYDGTTYTDVALYPLPSRFDTLSVTNTFRSWGIEADYIYRAHPGPHAGIWEFLLGGRYLEFDEFFNVDASGDLYLANVDGPDIPNAFLADATWNAKADNHIVGPQIGLRWFRQTNRWTWESDLRFLAGLNVQNLKQSYSFGSNMLDANYVNTNAGVSVPYGVPEGMYPTSGTHCATRYEWSPAVELRLNLKYQLTNELGLRVGWSGMWVDGIARASDIIDYSFRDTQLMGIDLSQNRQDLFVHGLTFGIDINR